MALHIDAELMEPIMLDFLFLLISNIIIFDNVSCDVLYVQDDYSMVFLLINIDNCIVCIIQ